MIAAFHGIYTKKMVLITGWTKKGVIFKVTYLLLRWFNVKQQRVLYNLTREQGNMIFTVDIRTHILAPVKLEMYWKYSSTTMAYKHKSLHKTDKVRRGTKCCKRRRSKNKRGQKKDEDSPKDWGTTPLGLLLNFFFFLKLKPFQSSQHFHLVVGSSYPLDLSNSSRCSISVLDCCYGWSLMIWISQRTVNAKSLHCFSG